MDAHITSMLAMPLEFGNVRFTIVPSLQYVVELQIKNVDEIFLATMYTTCEYSLITFYHDNF